MRAIITHQPSCEVTRIKCHAEQTIFQLVTGENLRVDIAPSILEKRLKIDLSKPPSSLPIDIFCHPFMSRTVWNIAAPIVRSHPDIQRVFTGHPNLKALVSLDYEVLRQLPLRPYVTQALYLSHPFNFMCRAINSQEIHKAAEYICDFIDGDYLVKVILNLQSGAVSVTQ